MQQTPDFDPATLAALLPDLAVPDPLRAAASVGLPRPDRMDFSGEDVHDVANRNGRAALSDVHGTWLVTIVSGSLSSVFVTAGACCAAAVVIVRPPRRRAATKLRIATRTLRARSTPKRSRLGVFTRVEITPRLNNLLFHVA